jgi:hypothetical protein
LEAADFVANALHWVIWPLGDGDYLRSHMPDQFEAGKAKLLSGEASA